MIELVILASCGMGMGVCVRARTSVGTAVRAGMGAGVGKRVHALGESDAGEQPHGQLGI